MDKEIPAFQRHTVALLLARGPAGRFADLDGLRYKALLPINGRPLVDHVLTSLQDSGVEKVFIVQSPDERLQDVLTAHPKNTFIDVEGYPDSLAWSLAKALEKLAGCYDAEAFSRLFIMVTPCDIPGVPAGDFNKLISEALSQDAAIVLVMAPYDLVKGAFPHKTFQKLFHSDVRQAMASQGIVFASGELLRVKPVEGRDDFGLEVLDSIGQPVIGLDKMIDVLHKGRHAFWLWPNFIFQVFVRRMIAKGKGGDAFRLLADLMMGRITAQKIGNYLFAVFGVRFGVVTTNTASFSGDIDTYEDLKLITLPAPSLSSRAGTRGSRVSRVLSLLTDDRCSQGRSTCA